MTSSNISFIVNILFFDENSGIYFIGIEILREIKHAQLRNESFKSFYYLESIKFHICFLYFIVCLTSQLSRYHFRHKGTTTSSQNIHK